jgi:DNA invertase Pin-like site-specific DNA recombinase
MSPKKVTLPLDIYVRVSDVKGREGDSFISPKEQADRCHAAAVARGFKVGEVLEELNVSGGKMERPVLNEALERIHDGLSGGIIVARIDRFGRTVVGALDAIEKINEAGGVVITAEGDFDTSTAVGELVLNMMLSLAQFELRRIRDNWQAAKRRAVERGIHIAPRVPQGYVRGGDGRLVPNGKSAETIRNAFSMAAQGDTYSMIAAYLNERQLPTWGGDGVWQPNRIRRLLANRVYLGEARSGNGHVNPTAHEPLVDAGTFELAQRQVASAPTITRKPREDVAMLASLVRCASCRFAMKYQKARENAVAIYRCPRHSVHGTCSAPSSISADRLEDHVIEQFLARALEIRDARLLEGEDAAEAVGAALEAERAYRAWLTNTAMQEALGADYEARLLALRAAWDDAKATIPVPTSAAIRSGSLAELIEELRADGDANGLRELLSTGVQAVFVRPAVSRAKNLPIEDRVHIVWMDEEPIEVPQRGGRFEPKPFTWD